MITIINGKRCELVEDDFVDYEKSSRTTIRMRIGDRYIRKKGHGWIREITGFVWIGTTLWIKYTENLGNENFIHSGCSVHALLNWGRKI